ncbi:probable terpene synthase 4 [Jatropha curcas]|nr:probable terpene synthase 4 [Jatropha curcas]
MELAKFDFNMLQSLHRDEIVHISKWWKDNFRFAAEMKFGREETLEWISWPMATLADPNLSAQRLELAKVVSLFHLIEDVFHFYGSIDQLTLFVQAVNRWDIAAANYLPEYMKMCLRTLYDITDEIADKIYNGCGHNPKRSLRNAWTKLCNAFLGAAKWAAVGQLPKAEHYLKMANRTSAVNVVFLHIFFLLGEALTTKTINLVDNDPDIISSAASIFTLSESLKTTKDEDRNGGFGSYMKCYMREYPLSSVEDSKLHSMEMISDSWKRLNKQCLSPNPFSPSFTRAALNCARLAPLVYGFDNNHNLPSLQKSMKSLLFERIAI